MGSKPERGGQTSRIGRIEETLAELGDMLRGIAAEKDAGTRPLLPARSKAAPQSQKESGPRGSDLRPGSDLTAVRRALSRPALSEVPAPSKKDLSQKLREKAGPADGGLPHGGAGEDDDEDEEPFVDPRDPTGSLMLAAAQALLDSRSLARRKKSRVFGLDDDDDSRSGGEEGLKGSRGLARHAKLVRSMARNPEAFLANVRDRAARHVSGADGAGADDPRLLESYVRQIPLEHQKHFVYYLWTMAHASRLMTEGKTEQAHLLLWRATASVEQSLLDGQWKTAWGVSGLPEPPWADWERTDARVHRLTFPASPLMPETWVSTAIAKVRDEKFLRDQREQPGHEQVQEPAAEEAGEGGGRGRPRRR